MVLKIGTDCSGIEAPIQALNKMGINYKHIFSCEIDKYARESIKVNYNPEKIYYDITKERELKDIDIYICGFPCQSHSMAGKRLGSKDTRGNIFLNCINVIKNKNPSLFILENVRGILTVENGEYWKHIEKKLKSLKEYNIKWKILNTKDYGIPQNRERIYIIGIRKDKQKKEYNFPKKIKCKDINKYIDKKNNIPSKINWRKDKIVKMNKSKGVFIDLNYLNVISIESYKHYSPTIMTGSRLWCVPLKRHATIKELLSLQGFPKKFKQIVSNTQMKKQIGNSMSVNVLVELFKECFNSLGWD
jgi:DNA (cytosine-5)-methyltransferase 1